MKQQLVAQLIKSRFFYFIIAIFSYEFVKRKALAKKVKELIDTQSCFADWLSNTNVRAKLNQDLWFLLDENGYPPEWSDDVFDQVLDQVENYKEHQSAPRLYSVNTDYYPFMVAEP